MAVLVTKHAPDFVAPAVMADGSIKENFSLSSLRGKYHELIFWPLAFFFVCFSVFFMNVRRANDAQTRSVYAGGTSRLNDSGRHGSSFDDNSHGGFAPRMVATAAFTCAAIASSSTPLRGPYSRDCTARTAACTSRSMPNDASHSQRPRSKQRPPNAANNSTNNGCCACGGATFFCADAFISTTRGRAERHHSASVASHSTANIKLPHCQRWALPTPDKTSAGVAVDLFVEVCAI